MNSDLKQFASKYLSLVAGTLMVVSFVAFISIPYSLGGHPGESNVARASVDAPTQIALDAHLADATGQAAITAKL
ncbi:MAG: hypothetical protein PHH58_02555 [Rhodoferax sp.]|nr:hypothetical protein [Rhodoferax sp.]